MSINVMFSNEKGGVGKTTNSIEFCYQMAKRGKKVLLCDLDPQSNASQLLERTYYAQNGHVISINDTIMRAIEEKDLPDSVVKVMNNLYMIPSYMDFYNYPKWLLKKFLPLYNGNFKWWYDKMSSYFSELIKPLESKFDYIVTDVPPTIDMYVDSALMMTDDIVIVMQTQQRSFDGAKEFISYIQKFYNSHPQIDFNILGVIPVIMKKRSPNDHDIYDQAVKQFGKNNIFDHAIHSMERLKRYDTTGITEKGYTNKYDYHDTKVNNIYKHLTNEVINRMKQMGGNN